MRLSMLLRFVSTTLVGLFISATAYAIPAIVVAPGTSPAGGYLALSLFGISPIAGVGDETITNYNVPSFNYAGQSWTRLGIVSNGYVVVGGGTSADVQAINADLPNLSAPGNILAPFWTNLNPALAGAMRIAALTDGLDTWVVVDWAAVGSANDSNELNSFEIWIGINTDTNPGEDISFVYDAVGNGDGGLLTVGAQDISRTVGDSYYFNGTGALPISGTQLRVTTRDLPISIPEPATLVLFGLGLVGLAVSRRHKY